jgi:hypothetical protein
MVYRNRSIRKVIKTWPTHQLTPHLFSPWIRQWYLPLILIASVNRTSEGKNTASIEFIFCIIHTGNKIQCLHQRTKYMYISQHTGSSGQHVRCVHAEIPSYSPVIFANAGGIVCLCSFLLSPCYFSIHYKTDSIMTWFLSVYNTQKRYVEFPTLPFYWAVYKAFGLSVDLLTRAVECKHRWWMAMLIKGAESWYSSGSFKCLFSTNI